MTSASVPRVICESSDDLPTPGAREDADALAAPERRQRVDRAHSGLQRHVDRRAHRRARRRRAHVAQLGARELRAAVERTAEAVDHAPEQRRSDRRRERPAERDDRLHRRDAGEVAVRHQERALPAESDHLRVDRAEAAAIDAAQLADRRRDADGLDEHSGDDVDAPAEQRPRAGAHVLANARGVELQEASSRRRSAIAESDCSNSRTSRPCGVETWTSPRATPTSGSITVPARKGTLSSALASSGCTWTTQRPRPTPENDSASRTMPTRS
jgi:hypothetical protein